jgi:uncharacterized OB-fold protein
LSGEVISGDPNSRRPLPVLDEQTGYYWCGGAQGQLLIARCDRCRLYQHPPLQRCSGCGGDEFTPSPVSGRGRVATYTVNHEPWIPGLPVPFVFAAVELQEQSGLYVFSNIVSPRAVVQVRVGMPVVVFFERHGDIYLPLFRPDAGD